jgi:hypothetical protein
MRLGWGSTTSTEDSEMATPVGWPPDTAAHSEKNIVYAKMVLPDQKDLPFPPYNPSMARKTAAQHRDNCRAFVTTNGCFPSKATKDPLTFVEERRPLFSAKRQR